MKTTFHMCELLIEKLEDHSTVNPVLMIFQGDTGI